MSKNKLPLDDLLAMQENDEESYRNPRAQAYFDGEANAAPLVGQKFNLDNIVRQDEEVSQPDASLVPQNPQLKRYEELMKQLSGNQKLERDNLKNINMSRGSNQIAQGIAAMYGGKVGDGGAQLDSIAESASKPVNDLLTQMKGIQGGMNPDMQVVNLVNPKTKATETYLLNKRTGERALIGEAGYSPMSFKDPLTGNQMVAARSVTAAAEAPIQVGGKSEPQVQPQTQNYKYSDFLAAAPKLAKDYIQPIQEKFQKDVEEPRNVATAITIMNRKLNPANPYASIDSGNLGAIQTQAAKMSGQKGVLTDQDLVKFAGAGGVKAWIDRFASGAMGAMSEADVAFFKRFSELMNQSLEQDIQNRAQMYASQLQQTIPDNILPNFSKENAMQWLSVDQVAPITSQSPIDESKKKAAMKLLQDPNLAPEKAEALKKKFGL